MATFLHEKLNNEQFHSDLLLTKTTFKMFILFSHKIYLLSDWMRFCIVCPYQHLFIKQTLGWQLKYESKLWQNHVGNKNCFPFFICKSCHQDIDESLKKIGDL
jgi:hypothetical protein